MQENNGYDNKSHGDGVARIETPIPKKSTRSLALESSEPSTTEDKEKDFKHPSGLKDLYFIPDSLNIQKEHQNNLSQDKKGFRVSCGGRARGVKKSLSKYSICTEISREERDKMSLSVISSDSTGSAHTITSVHRQKSLNIILSGKD